MKSLALLFTVFLLVSCASVRVDYDYETNTDFSKYKTYNYFSNVETGLSELDAKRLFDALDEAMQAKGFTQSDTPDFYIDIKSSEQQQPRNSNVGVGVGGGGRNVGGGVSIGIPVGQNGINRRVMFDFVDQNGHGLFWQAITESTYSPNATPEKREAQLKAIVNKALAGYPPKK